MNFPPVYNTCKLYACIVIYNHLRHHSSGSTLVIVYETYNFENSRNCLDFLLNRTCFNNFWMPTFSTESKI